MKASIALCAVSFSSWALGAPVLMVLKNTHTTQPGVSVKNSDSAAPVVLPTKSHLRIPAKVTIEKESDVKNVMGLRPGDRPDNRPFIPSEHTTPSQALAAERPLRTSYLLSLSPASKGQASIHDHETESSIVREETGSNSRTNNPTIVELETEGSKPFFYRIPCRMKPEHYHQVRRYADMAIVGVVLVFLAVVFVVELWQPICRRVETFWGEEGAIRLEVDEKANIQSFVLQPAPRPKSQLRRLPSLHTIPEGKEEL